MLFSSTQAKMGCLVSLVLISSSALLTSRAYAQEPFDCPISPLVPISGTAKEYRNPSLGFKFKVPSNYIVSEKVDPSSRLLFISNPSIHSHTECLKQNQVQTTVLSVVTVGVYEENLEGKDVNAYLLSRASALPPPQISGARYIDEIPRTVTILNQPGVYYSTRNPDGAAYVLAFMSPDKMLIEISTPYNWRDQKPVALFEKEVFDQVINSFTFISEASDQAIPETASQNPTFTEIVFEMGNQGHFSILSNIGRVGNGVPLAALLSSEVDLNGDGSPEIVTTLDSSQVPPSFCGNRGCSSEIFTQQDGSWSQIFGLLGGRPLAVAGSSTNGYRDIAKPIGSTGRIFLAFSFNGQEYVRSYYQDGTMRIPAVVAPFEVTVTQSVSFFSQPSASHPISDSPSGSVLVLGQVDNWYLVQACPAFACAGSLYYLPVDATR